MSTKVDFSSWRRSRRETQRPEPMELCGRGDKGSQRRLGSREQSQQGCLGRIKAI